MAQFFVIGNVWLIIALLLALGSHVERTQPTMVAFFGLGAWFDPGMYMILVELCVAAAIVCFTLAWKSRRQVL